MDRNAVGMASNKKSVDDDDDDGPDDVMLADSTPPALGAAEADDDPDHPGGGSGGGMRPSEGGTGGSGTGNVVAYLSVRKQPPLHVFPGEAFDVEFSIEAARGTSDSPPTNVSVQASLVVASAALSSSSAAPEQAKSALSAAAASPESPGDDVVLSVLEEPRISASRRTGKVRCRVRILHASQDASSAMPLLPRSFAIKLSTKEAIVSEVTTRRVQIVAAKLRVVADPWNPIWYKDEGGRDKCMEVHVQAHDVHDQLVTDATGPLRLSLCYDEKSNYMAVTNQDLLRPLGTKQTNALEDGRARVRFRIEDVSKNHQGQDFAVRIAAAHHPSIAPGYTPSVSVRSKRNKRQRVGTTTTSMGGGGSTDASSASQQPHPPSATVGGVSRLSGGAVPHLSSSRSVYDPGYHPSPRMMLEATSPNEQDSMIRGAIQGVAQWADDVVNNLYALQWQVLGYAQGADGSPDYARPYHSMPNPNQPISRILSQYSESIHGQLRLLEEVAAVQQGGALLGGGGSAGAAGTAGMAVGMDMGAAAATAGAVPTAATESPYSGGMVLPQQDPYGSMMMPPQHRPPSAHALTSYLPPTGVPPQHSHHPSQPPLHPSIPMRMATGPPTAMDAYRDYPMPSPATPGDYYGRMHPSPPVPPHGVHMHPHHPYHAGAAAGTGGASSRYDDPDPMQAPQHSRPAKHHHPAFGASGSTGHAAASTRRGGSTDDDDDATGQDDPDDNEHPPASGGAGSRRGRDESEDDDDDDDDDDDECVESNVEYVLAKQYKSLRTGHHLGFPAFSARRRLLGFYRDKASSSSGASSAAAASPGSSTSGAGIAASMSSSRTGTDNKLVASVPRGFKFVPLSRSAVDRGEIVRQASEVLQRALETRSEALHALKDWGSIVSMVDHALVYDWSKDVPSRRGASALTTAAAGPSGPGISRPPS